MVRFSLRSVAFLALSLVAAASPLAQNFGQPAAAGVAAVGAPQPAAVAAPAAQVLAGEDRSRNVAYQNAPVPAAKPPQGQKCVMVPCSEEECLRNMTPQEQAEFRNQCDAMRREGLHEASKSGKSRVATDAGKLTYYKMLTPQEAAAQQIAGGKTAYITPMNTNDKIVGSRPAGKNLAAVAAARAAATAAAAE
ncbi:hypothetical protein LPJ61_004644 [Coemansia biformis]|uniref:Uncharacterized protein n=1 Tax=Coemansia biformis TaxID=1286918 RepID=A0A9W7YBF9_9FUNG|nr:hypothetical protein LPJ61_004644 [Coemansia biformis]